jgi:hypothetical protein
MRAYFQRSDAATVWLTSSTESGDGDNPAFAHDRATELLEGTRLASILAVNRGNDRTALAFEVWKSCATHAAARGFQALQASLLASDGDFYLIEEDPDGEGGVNEAQSRIPDAQVKITSARFEAPYLVLQYSVIGGAFEYLGTPPLEPNGFAEITGQQTNKVVAAPGMVAGSGNIQVTQVAPSTGGFTQFWVVAEDDQFRICVPQCPEIVNGDGLTFNFAYNIVSLF